jgi:hypothetical protein
MKMTELILAVLISIGVFGGGFFVGQNKADKEHDKVVLSLIEESKEQNDRMYTKLDSLKHLPSKIDTVRFAVDRVEYKTDTLILISKEVFANTDTIKNELRQYINK